MLILDSNDSIHLSIYLKKLSITQKHLPLWPNSETSFTLLLSKGFHCDEKQGADYTLGFKDLYIKFDDVHVKSDC